MVRHYTNADRHADTQADRDYHAQTDEKAIAKRVFFLVARGLGIQIAEAKAICVAKDE